MTTLHWIAKVEDKLNDPSLNSKEAIDVYYKPKCRGTTNKLKPTQANYNGEINNTNNENKTKIYAKAY